MKDTLKLILAVIGLIVVLAASLAIIAISVYILIFSLRGPVRDLLLVVPLVLCACAIYGEHVYRCIKLILKLKESE